MDELRTAVLAQLRERSASAETLALWEEIWSAFEEGDALGVETLLEGLVELPPDASEASEDR